MRVKRSAIFGGLLLLGIGFAAVTTTLYINGNVNISSNQDDFDVRFTKAVIDNEDKTSDSISSDGKTITYQTKELVTVGDKSILDFNITNNSSIYDAEISINCVAEGENKDYYSVTKEVASLILAKQTEPGKVEVEKIKMSDKDIEESFTCTLTATAKERTTKGIPKVNQNIEKAYAYDKVNCVTGEESTCEETTCYRNKDSNSCLSGTIIKYHVNDSEIRYFHVLHDDGLTMTLQQRENTVYNVSWNLDTNGTKGPLSILPKLEEATNNWINVDTINYTMGSTNFNDTNSYTGCTINKDQSITCAENGYVLEKRSSKARMMTVQEAVALGCGYGISSSCPNWIYNYLRKSISYGGTVNDTKTENGAPANAGYWTMQLDTSNVGGGFYIDEYGFLGIAGITNNHQGARAVIEITK